MHRNKFAVTLIKVIFGLLFILSATMAKAVDYPVTVSRDASDYYLGKFSFLGVIKTQFCFQFVFFDNATLRLNTSSTGTLIFSSGQQCAVTNVFDPTSVAAGVYSASVNSNGDGYYEFTDGSFLLKAAGSDFNFGAAATLNLTSAVNGFASGTIAVSGKSAQQLSNIYYSRQPPPLQSQTITFGAQSNRTFINGGVFSINPATASSGLPVTYLAGPSNICTMGSGTTVNMISDGTCTITASQAGNSTYSAAVSVSRDVVISWAIFHSCAVVNGGVQCWGYNGNGELGNNTTTTSTVPVQAIPAGSNVTAVASGLYHACAIVGGGVQCWGYNGDGQLGNNTTSNSLVPVQAITANSNVTAISAGYFHTCVVTGGGVQCWGYNGDGELGIGNTTNSLVPVQTIPPGSNATSVAAGVYHSCAAVNGGVQCWGYNGDGQFGNGTTTASLVPVQTIATGNNVTAVAAAIGRTCAVVNGGVQCWGFNGSGQLGNNSTVSSLVPVQAVAAGSNATAVATALYHTCAVVNGGVQCWGYNGQGELGNNSTSQSPTPIQTIAAGSNATALSLGAYHSCATVNRGVNCWGYNYYGQLGNNSTTQSLIPVQTIAAIGVPGAPTGFSAIPGNAQATFTFLAPTNNGGSPITGYTATCNPGAVTGTALASPLNINLNNGTLYTCSVTASNAIGTSPASGTVTVTPSATVAPTLIGVVSRKTHGATGAFDVVIDTAPVITGLVSVEPRTIGNGHTIMFQFNNTINASGTIAVVDGSGASLGASAFAPGNDATVTVTIPSLADNKRITLTLTGVNGTVNPNPVSMGFLVGDVNNTRSVNSSDISAVKARSGQTTTGANFKFDVNASGAINSSDISAVKARSGLTLP